MSGEGPLLGVVVPTLDEEELLPSLLADLERLTVPHTVVVSDGGSRDGTAAAAVAGGAEVVRAPRGRASQLDAGARALDTPWLLFLHADVRVPAEARRAIVRWVEREPPERAAHFAFRLQGDHWFWRFIEFGQGLRERISGLAYGDQGLLVSRTLYRAVGGYPDQPLMEDVEILRRLRRTGEVRRLDAPLLTSPRRYRREGRWSAWLRNTALITLYLSGVPARRLARWYRPEPRASRDPEGRRTLLIFAKAPDPGRVKTRLARSLGAERAADLYRRMGRRIVDQLRSGPYRTVVCFDPPEARERIREWLGPGELELEPQGPGGLGRRMARAAGSAFRDAGRVCIVGTDAPDVDRTVVEEAFRRLDGADVVLGPATDGGYYLVALKRPAPEIFRDVPWSTSDVLDVTLERIRRAGLEVALLEERSDVDTVEDLDARALDGARRGGGP